MIDPETQTGWVPEADEVDEEEEMPLSLRLSIADTLTLGNATCGFMAVYFTTTGILIPHLTGSQETGMARHSAATAVILMLCAAVFDLFDGLVARKLRSSPMGAELDNLSDLISFGLAPAYFVLVYGMVADDAHQRVAAVGAIVVLLAVVLRLARFSCVTVKDGTFQGMPIAVRRADGGLDRAARAALRGDASRDPRYRLADGEPGRVPEAAGPSRGGDARLDRRCRWASWRPGRSTPPAASCSCRRAARSSWSWAR